VSAPPGVAWPIIPDNIRVADNPDTGTWRMYRFWGYLPATTVWARLLMWLLGPRERLLYLGITSRLRPAQRAFEHAIEKSWAGQATRWEVATTPFGKVRTWDSEAAAEAAELAAIRTECPVYNIVGNSTLPGREPRERWRLSLNTYVARQYALALVLAAAFLTGLLRWAFPTVRLPLCILLALGVLLVVRLATGSRSGRVRRFHAEVRRRQREGATRG
jgi:hypothetical protein